MDKVPHIVKSISRNVIIELVASILDPSVVVGLLSCVPLIDIFDQQLRDEVLGVSRDHIKGVVLEVVLAPHHVLYDFFVGFTWEWDFPGEHDIEDYSYRP